MIKGVGLRRLGLGIAFFSHLLKDFPMLRVYVYKPEIKAHMGVFQRATVWPR